MLTINIYYRGADAIAFMNEMESSGVADAIRKKDGCLRYDYFIPTKEENCVLLIDSWKNQQALDEHHHSDLMPKIAELRDKYDVHMTVERYVSEENIDTEYIRK